MTTPVKPEPTGRVLTGDEWEAAQYAPHRLTSDPKKPLPAGRVLTGDEWEQAQRAGSLRSLTFPAMPKFAADATRRLNPNAGKPDNTLGEDVVSIANSLDQTAKMMPGGVGSGALQLAGILGRQVVAPVVEHPIMTAAMLNPVGGVVGGMMAAHTVAKYGWQVAHESQMTPEERAEALKDPDRVSGEAAAFQGIMLGLGAIAGVRGARAVSDVGAGMMEAGARGVRETDFGFSPEVGDAARTSNLRAQVTESATRYFESQKGAEVLGTTAAARGLPETASPYPPASALDVAWKEGHSESTPPPNITRLYRTETPRTFNENNPDSGYRYFSDDLEYAKIYRGDKRSYIDVPTSELANHPPMQSETSALIYRLPAEIAAKRLPLPFEMNMPEAGQYRAPASAIPPEVAPPVTPEPAPSGSVAGPPKAGLTPIEGTGDIKTRGLSLSTERMAIERDLGPLSELPEYRTLKDADQGAKALEFLARDPEAALRVAMGDEAAPKGLNSAAMFVALRNRAMLEGDALMVDNLARSKMAEQATSAGQFIHALGVRDPSDPTAAVRGIADTRLSGGGRNAERVVARDAADLGKNLKAAGKIEPGSFEAFINSLRC